MARSNVNLQKRIIEDDFYRTANIRVSVAGRGMALFLGNTFSRSGEVIALARVQLDGMPHGFIDLVPLVSVTVISAGGAP